MRLLEAKKCLMIPTRCKLMCIAASCLACHLSISLASRGTSPVLVHLLLYFPSLLRISDKWTIATAYDFNSFSMKFSAGYGYQLSDSLMWSAFASTTLHEGFTFGGPKSSRGARPTVESMFVSPVLFSFLVGSHRLLTVADFLMWGDLSPLPNPSVFDYATVPIVYVSLRNDTLHFNTNAGFAPPVVKTEHITNWVWVADPSLSKFPCSSTCCCEVH
jgi:hypothetical protein